MRHAVLIHCIRLGVGAALALAVGGCSPVLRPDHCANQDPSQMLQTCGSSQICTNSRCPGLAWLPSQNDIGCRDQGEVFSAMRAATQVQLDALNACLVGMRPSQNRVIERIQDERLQRQQNASGGVSTDASGPVCPGSDDVAQGTGGGPDRSAEPQCRQDSDCVGHPMGPYCDPVVQRCHACVPHVAQHCPDPDQPVCDEHLGHRSCQACSVDLDCVRSERGAFCQKQTHDGAYQARCVACATDLHCAQVSGRPYCEPRPDGLPPRCVSCITDAQCGGPGLRCERRTCVGCTALEGQCQAGGACWWWPGGVGSCSDQVIYVDSSPGVDCLLGNGSVARPYCRIDEAIEWVQPQRWTTIRVKGDHVLHRGLTLGPQSRVQIIGHTRSRLELTGTGQSLISAGDDVRLSLSRLELRAQRNHALVCQGGSSQVRLEDLRIVGGEGSALVVQGCSLRGTRLEILNHQAYAAQVDAGALYLSSSIIAGNGRADRDNGGAILLDGGSLLELEHVSIAGNMAQREASVLRCVGNEHRISVRDSIVMQLRAPVGTNCKEASITAKRNWSDVSTLVGSAGYKAPQGSADLSFMRSVNQGQLRLREPLLRNADTSRLSTLGLWMAGDAPFDVDGQRWAVGQGFVGADQGIWP